MKEHHRSLHADRGRRTGRFAGRSSGDCPAGRAIALETDHSESSTSHARERDPGRGSQSRFGSHEDPSMNDLGLVGAVSELRHEAGHDLLGLRLERQRAALVRRAERDADDIVHALDAHLALQRTRVDADGGRLRDPQTMAQVRKRGGASPSSRRHSTIPRASDSGPTRPASAQRAGTNTGNCPRGAVRGGASSAGIGSCSSPGRWRARATERRTPPHLSVRSGQQNHPDTEGPGCVTLAVLSDQVHLA
jgi:hypothetical protein